MTNIKELNLDIEKLREFYSSHSLKDTEKEFGISSYRLLKIFKANNIEKHSAKEESRLYKLHNGNLYSINRQKEFEELISNIDTEELKLFYKSHSTGDVGKKYNLAMSQIKKLFNLLDIELHSRQENIFLNNKNHGNRYADKKKLEFEELLKSIDIDEFYSYYRTEGLEYTADKYSLSKGRVLKIIDFYGLKRLSATETRDINFIHNYGSIEEGKRILYTKTHSNVDYEARTKKTAETNLKRWGYASVLSCPEIQDKIKATNLAKTGYDNPFKNPEVQAKIQEDQKNEYGGIGFASDLIREKYNATMLEKWNVEWGCLLPQCYDARTSHSSNTGPNEIFRAILEEYDVEYSHEFILSNYRYDFKVDNILIEINPSATHNSTWSPYGHHEGVEKDYHLNKSKIALDNGYRCIHVWEWDDMEKIVRLFLVRESVYARSTQVREVPLKEAKVFINNNHLQGYAKDEIRLGLYLEDELISIMTFGKPRYNKNHEYELIRYCSSKNVIGGAEKLFKHFIDDFNPNSVISYCDMSKFSGRTYEKLGFKGKKYSPSRHWYNIRTHKHITDNLLRQRGFDQLFGTNYGKGTSNEELMFENGFLDIYDAGQRTYIYKKD